MHSGFAPGAVRGGHGQGGEEDRAPRWEPQQELCAVVLPTELSKIRSTNCSETSHHLLSIIESPGRWGQGPLPRTAASSLHSAAPSGEGNKLGRGCAE